MTQKLSWLWDWGEWVCVSHFIAFCYMYFQYPVMSARISFWIGPYIEWVQSFHVLWSWTLRVTFSLHENKNDRIIWKKIGMPTTVVLFVKYNNTEVSSEVLIMRYCSKSCMNVSTYWSHPEKGDEYFKLNLPTIANCFSNLHMERPSLWPFQMQVLCIRFTISVILIRFGFFGRIGRKNCVDFICCLHVLGV